LQVDAGERAFAQTDAGRGGGGVVIGAYTEEMAQELRDVGIVADDEDVFVGGAFTEEALELCERGGRGERWGYENFLLVAGFGGD